MNPGLSFLRAVVMDAASHRTSSAEYVMFSYSTVRPTPENCDSGGVAASGRSETVFSFPVVVVVVAVVDAASPVSWSIVLEVPRITSPRSWAARERVCGRRADLVRGGKEWSGVRVWRV